MSIKHISVDQLEHVIAGCFSFRAVAEKFGLPNNGGTLTRLRKKAIENKIDFSHFTGQLWSKGKTALDDSRIRKADDIFVENSSASTHYVRTLIIKKNIIDYRCVKCDNDGIWHRKKLNLELDHINGNSRDNRLENLRWLCPNCHSQTETYCGKNINKGTKKVSDDVIKEQIKKGLNNRQILVNIGLTPKGGNYNRINRLRNTGE